MKRKAIYISKFIRVFRCDSVLMKKKLVFIYLFIGKAKK